MTLVLLLGIGIGLVPGICGALFWYRRSRETAAACRLQLEKYRREHLHMAETQTVLEQEKAGLDDLKFDIVERNLDMLELKEQLEVEKERSEKLLRNILPERVISELRATGKSEPESFEAVTVFFSDIVNFTEKSAKVEPRILIEELSDIFTNFDHIFVANGCERIKTIGDAYLSVSGLPVPCAGHCDNILRAAMAAMRYLDERNHDGKHLVWEMRMGVHTGRVVGGIVGTEKYIYDVFGDTINTASRMESYSEPMAINVSHVTRELAREEFCFTERPSCSVKGKGAQKMFFLCWRPQYADR